MLTYYECLMDVSCHLVFPFLTFFDLVTAVLGSGSFVYYGDCSTDGPQWTLGGVVSADILLTYFVILLHVLCFLT